jgi:hypothetical protein
MLTVDPRHTLGGPMTTSTQKYVEAERVRIHALDDAALALELKQSSYTSTAFMTPLAATQHVYSHNLLKAESEQRAGLAALPNVSQGRHLCDADSDPQLRHYGDKIK